MKKSRSKELLDTVPNDRTNRNLQSRTHSHVIDRILIHTAHAYFIRYYPVHKCHISTCSCTPTLYTVRTATSTCATLQRTRTVVCPAPTQSPQPRQPPNFTPALACDVDFSYSVPGAHFSTLDGARGRVADFSRFGADLASAPGCTLADLTSKVAHLSS